MLYLTIPLWVVELVPPKGRSILAGIVGLAGVVGYILAAVRYLTQAGVKRVLTERAVRRSGLLLLQNGRFGAMARAYRSWLFPTTCFALCYAVAP